MSVSVQRQRLRLQIDVSRWYNLPVDIITGVQPKIANGSDIELDLAFTFGSLVSDAQLVDMNGWASITITLKDVAGINSAAYWGVTIGNAYLNKMLTFDNWATGVDQHVAVVIPGAQNSVLLDPSALSAKYWLVISALATNSAVPFPVAAAQVIIQDTGASVAVPRYVQPPQYLTKDQSDAAYVPTGGMNGYLPLSAGNANHLTGPLYTKDVHSEGSIVYATTIRLVGSNGTRDITLGADGEVHGL